VATRPHLSVRKVLLTATAALLTVALVPQPGQADPRPSIDQVEARLSALEVQAEQSQEKLNDARVAEAAAQRKLTQVAGRVKAAEAQVGAARGAVGQLAAAAYRSGGVDQSLQLVLADDANQFLAQASALDGVARRQGDVLRRLAVAQQRLAQDKLALAQTVGQLAQIRATAATEERAVRSKVAETERLLASLKAEERAQLEARQRAASARAAAEARAAAARAITASRPSRSGSGRSTVPPSVGGSGLGARAAAYALAQVGDRYVWGAAGPSSFDCSGLTMAAYRTVGISLPHSSRAQIGSGRRVSSGDLQPGDLVFYYSPISHVGIYIGGGRIVHAANPRSGVRVASVFSMPYSGATRPY